jgi:hypothetical protein
MYYLDVIITYIFVKKDSVYNPPKVKVKTTLELLLAHECV